MFLLVASALPAAAITGGERDGNDYPNVGLILFYTADGPSRCSATLIEPDLLLTAAHCTAGTLGSTLVTFDPVIAETGPLPFPVAADPTVGYTSHEVTAAGYLAGTASTHLQYADLADLNNPYDVGVIRLESPVVGIEPSEIAPQNFLDQFSQPRLNSTSFTVVGYGTEVRKPLSGAQKPEPMTYPLVRRVTTSAGQKLTPQILQLNGNPNDIRGGGGICSGDSGGPVFIDGYLVAVTSYGYTAHCRHLAAFQRVDVPVVQSWLASLEPQR